MNSPDNDLIAIWPSEAKFANITWQVSDVCNFKCSYCNPGNFGANHRNLETDIYIENLREIVKHFQDNGYEAFRFFFSGGEPTVWPPLVPILEYIRAEIPGSLVAINTNLSKPTDWWKKHYTLTNDIVASFHVEFCNKDVYLENLDFLQDKMDYLVCRLLMHDERFQEVVDFADTIKKRLDNYTIEYAALFEALSPHSEMHYYEDKWKREFLQTHSLDERKLRPKQPGVPPSKPSNCVDVLRNGDRNPHNSNRLVLEGKNDFRGWKCWINDSLFINPMGLIKAASCNMSVEVGNIALKGLKFTNKPVICKQARCNCGTDIGIRKAHPVYESIYGRQK